MSDLVSRHVVINALRAVDGISCPPPGGSHGYLDYVRLQFGRVTLAQAVARPLDGSRPHWVRLQMRRGVVASRLPKEAVGSLQITRSGEVIVTEEDVVQGARLIEYLIQREAGGEGSAAPTFPRPRLPLNRPAGRQSLGVSTQRRIEAASEPGRFPAAARELHSAPSYMPLPDNPWRTLPDEPPFIAASDRLALTDLVRQRCGVHLETMPHPWHGNPATATALLLLTNPGWNEAEIEQERTHLQYREIVRKAFLLDPGVGFWPLRSEVRHTSAADFWRPKLRPLRDMVDDRAINERLTTVQFFPYHSGTDRNPPIVPSQQFTFALVRQALERGALVIVMRKWDAWRAAVPALSSSPRLLRNPNPRQLAISPGNLGRDAFAEIVHAVRG